MTEALKDFILRLEQLMADPDFKPLVLHWSDLVMLRVVVDRLDAQDRQDLVIAELCRAIAKDAQQS